VFITLAKCLMLYTWVRCNLKLWCFINAGHYHPSLIFASKAGENSCMKHSILFQKSFEKIRNFCFVAKFVKKFRWFCDNKQTIRFLIRFSLSPGASGNGGTLTLGLGMVRLMFCYYCATNGHIFINVLLFI